MVVGGRAGSRGSPNEMRARDMGPVGKFEACLRLSPCVDFRVGFLQPLVL